MESNKCIGVIQFLCRDKILKDGFGIAEHEDTAFTGHIHGKMQTQDVLASEQHHMNGNRSE